MVTYQTLAEGILVSGDQNSKFREPNQCNGNLPYHSKGNISQYNVSIGALLGDFWVRGEGDLIFVGRVVM